LETDGARKKIDFTSEKRGFWREFREILSTDGRILRFFSARKRKKSRFSAIFLKKIFAHFTSENEGHIS
jgi:hypothetical protein